MKSLALLIVLFVSAPAFAGTYYQYQLTDLGALGTCTGDSRACGINSRGDVAGWAFTSENELRHAYKYLDGSMHDMCPSDSHVSEAHGVNDHGAVVGWSFCNDSQHATLWNSAGTLEDLDPRGTRSSANAVNESGLVTGDADFGFGTEYHAFIAEAGQALRDLGTLGGTTSCGTAINSAGAVAGWSLTADGSRRAFFCAADETTSMHELPIGGVQSQANGMNDWNEVVGWKMDASGQTRAFAYSPAGEAMPNLRALGGVSSAANDIDNNGDIVGWWSPDGSSRRAFAVLENHMIDLNTLIDPASGWTLVEASAINECGQIVGYGIDPTGTDRGFILTPASLVPSPASAAILLSSWLMSLLRHRKIDK